jgi:hypothetical protein
MITFILLIKVVLLIFINYSLLNSNLFIVIFILLIIVIYTVLIIIAVK